MITLNQSLKIGPRTLLEEGPKIKVLKDLRGGLQLIELALTGIQRRIKQGVPWEQSQRQRTSHVGAGLRLPNRTVRFAVFVSALLLCQFAPAQTHRNLPNAALVEPAKYTHEPAILRWDPGTGVGEAWLVTAYDMDGRKKWSLRTSDSKFVLKRESQAFEVVITPVRAGARAPDWVALEKAAGSQSTSGVESSLPANTFVGPAVTPTPVRVQTPPPTPLATPVVAVAPTQLPLVASPSTTPAPAPIAQVTPTPTLPPIIPRPPEEDEEELLKGGSFFAAGLMGRGIMSISRDDLDLTAAADVQGAAVGWTLPMGPWLLHSLWVEGIKVKDKVPYQPRGSTTSQSVDLGFLFRGGDMGLFFNPMPLFLDDTSVLVGFGPIVANRLLPALPENYESQSTQIPDLESLPQLAVGGGLVLGFRGESVSFYAQGHVESDGQGRGFSRIGRVLLGYSPYRPLSVFTGATLEEVRLNFCRGTDEHCIRRGQTRVRLYDATVVLGLGLLW